MSPVEAVFVHSVPERLAYPIREAAVLMGSGKDTVYRLIKSGELDYIELGNRKLVPKASIVAYLQSLTRKAKAPCEVVAVEEAS